MKQLRYLALLLLLLPLAHKAQAQQITLECIVTTLTPCNSSSNPGNGSQGTPIWQAGGDVNTMFGQVYGMFGTSSNFKTTGTLLSTDISSRWTDASCSGGGALQLLFNGHCSTLGTPGGSSGYIQFNNGGVFGGVQYVPVANGGTGTSSPSIVAGTNVTVTGTWPNQTINSTGGGGTLSASGTPSAFQTPCWASSTTLSAFGPGTSGQVLTSNGAGSCPSFQSGTSYTGLPSDPSPIALTDLLAVYSQANTELTTVTPNLLSLFVGINSLASGTSVTPSCAYEDNYSTNTATGGTFTVNAPTGCTAVEGQKLMLHIKFTNSQTYSWNAAYVGGTTALPTTSTGSSKGDWIAFRYDSINSKWDYLAAATGF